MDSSVAVNEFVFAESEDGISVETGEVYYRSDIGAPILLKCNVSDIVPSAVISIVDSNGNILEYSPSISLKDGSVSRYGVENKVMDFTHYIYNESFESYIPQSDGVG